MKTAIALLIIIHGFIHLLGFFKAFQIAEIEELKQPISKINGVVWLTAFLIFAVTAVLYLAEIQGWGWLGIPGILLSQALIIQYWQDAKFGAIPNIFLALLIVFSL